MRGWLLALTIIILSVHAASVFGQTAEDAKSLNEQVARLYQQGKYAEAIAIVQRLLALHEKSLGPDRPEVATDLNNLALLYQSEGHYAEAEPLYKRSLAINEKVLGPDHPDVATSLSNLALVYGYEGRYSDAELLHKRALAIHEKSWGPEHIGISKDLNNLALVYQAEGRYADAEGYYKRALAIEEKAAGPDNTDVAQLLSNLAALYQAENRNADAEPLFRQAIAIHQKAWGPDHPGVAMDLGNLAVLYRTQGRYSEAEPLLKRAAAIHEKAMGPNHPAVATDICNLAVLYQDEGRYSEAEPLLKRALAIHEKAFGPDHPAVAIDLNNLAAQYHVEGRYSEAEPLFKASLAIHEKAFGPNHPNDATDLNNLALLYVAEGRYSDAEPLLKRAQDIDEKIFGPEHSDVATVLNNLAEVYRLEGRAADAEQRYKRALAILEKTNGPDHPGIATGLNNLALLYYGEGRYADAEPLYKRTLAINEKSFGADHPGVARALYNLALVYQAENRLAEAGPLYKRALAIFEKSVGPDHPDVALSLDGLARLALAQKDWAESAGNWRRATGILKHRTRRSRTVSSSLTGKAKSEAARNDQYFKGLIKVVDRLATENPTERVAIASESFDAAQWAQASDAAEAVAQMSLRGGKDTTDRAVLVRERQDLVAEWQVKDKALIASKSLAPDKRDAASEKTLADRLSAIDVRVSEIDAQFAKNYPDYAALMSSLPVAVPDVQSYLRPNEVLILTLDTDVSFKPLPEETFIWVITKTESRWVRSELGTKGLEDRVAALRCGLDEASWTDPGLDPAHWPEATEADKARKTAQAGRLARCKALVPERDSVGVYPPFNLKIAHELYDKLLGQVADLIKDKELLIVPSGALTSLPFSVLVTEEPKAAFPATNGDYKNVAWLVRDHAITVLPSVASLAALRRPRSSAEPVSTHRDVRPYLGIADPLLSGPDGKNRSAWDKQSCPEHLEANPAADVGKSLWLKSVLALRGETIAGLSLEELRHFDPLPNTTDEVCAVGLGEGAAPGEILLGENATKSRLEAMNKDNGLAKYKVVHFATHGLLPRDAGAEPALVLDPTKATVVSDALLTASDVTELKLDADWVILSACNTAAGEAPGAEALSGLARAFFYAGARSLLVSHWSVNSHSAVALLQGTFKAMHEAEAAHQPIGRAEALRRSINNYRTNPNEFLNTHPQAWASFVVVGEGGS